MNAREEILSRIGRAHELAPATGPEYDQVSRAYRDIPTWTGEDLVERLVDRLVDYRALVRRTTPADLPTTVVAALTERNIASLAIPPGLPGDWLSGAGLRTLVDDPGSPLTVEALDGVDGVVTGCAVAIAETGTLVLDGSADQGRRVLTLVPDYHLCVVPAEIVEADVPQAIARLDPTRPLTLISGPSATSDIELNRVEGVHGPRTLEVIIVEGGGGV